MKTCNILFCSLIILNSNCAYAMNKVKKNDLEKALIEATMFYENDESTSLKKLRSLTEKINDTQRLKTILSAPYLPSNQENTPLIIASFHGYITILRFILEYTKETIDYTNKDGLTALMFAGFNYNYQAIKELLKYGANINHQDKHGMTALIQASKRGYSLMVQFYIKYCNPDVSLKDNTDKTALDYAEENEKTALNEIKNEYKKIIELLKNAHKKD